MLFRTHRPSVLIHPHKQLQEILQVLLVFIVTTLSLSLTPPSAQAGQFTGLCTATVDQLNGQGRFSLNGLGRFSLNGLEGADARLDTSDGVPQSLINEVLGNPIDATWLQQYIDGWKSGNKPSVAPDKTVILIVDDFGQKTIDTQTVPADQRKKWNQQHLAVYGVPLPRFIEQVTHGDHVREVVESLKAELYNTGDQELQNLADHLWVVEVDISGAAGYQLDGVASQIRKTVEEYQHSYGIRRFIINMSFGLVPCEVQSLSRGGKAFSFERFQEQRNETPRFVFDVDFETANNEPMPVVYNGYSITDFFIDGYGGTHLDRGGNWKEDQAVKAVGELLSYPSTDIDSGEPDILQLRSLLSSYLQASKNGTMAVIPIAASGNYADVIPDAPLAPAKYPEVVAVGATLGMTSTSREWVYSQRAHILAPGAWYNFFTNASYSAGTSFAAPYTSFLAAMYVAFPEVCTFANAAPPLKNFNYIETTLYYDNLPFTCEYKSSHGTGYELIQNGGFENRWANGSPDLRPWQAKNNFDDKTLCNKNPKQAIAHSGQCAYVFKGKLGENSRLKQVIQNLPGGYNIGDTFEFSLYINAPHPIASTPGFKPKATIRFIWFSAEEFGGSEEKSRSTDVELTMKQTDGYEYFHLVYTLQRDDLKKIEVTINNLSPRGKVFVDDVSLKYRTAKSTGDTVLDLPPASQELLPLP